MTFVKCSTDRLSDLCADLRCATALPLGYRDPASSSSPAERPDRGALGPLSSARDDEKWERRVEPDGSRRASSRVVPGRLPLRSSNMCIRLDRLRCAVALFRPWISTAILYGLACLPCLSAGRNSTSNALDCPPASDRSKVHPGAHGIGLSPALRAPPTNRLWTS